MFQQLEPRLPLAGDANPVVEQVVVAEPPAMNLEVVFSNPMQLAPLIDDGSILSAVTFNHYRNGPVSLTAEQFAYSDASRTLTWSSSTALAPGFYELQLDGAALLDTDGNALIGGTDGLSFHLPVSAAEELVGSQRAPLTTGSYSVPSLADWNADGLLDLIVGEQDASGGKVRVYLNTGTGELPQYDRFAYAQYAGADLTVPCSGCLGVSPRLFDWNRDGLQDLVLGLSDGRVQVFPNTQTGTDPVFGEPSYVQVGEPGSKTELSVGARATVQIADWNNDGHHDLVTGGLDGKVRVFLNSADSGEPDLRSELIVQDSVGDLIVPTGRSGVAVTDLNGDGRKDLLLGNTEGQLIFYPNLGTDVEPVFDPWQALRADGVEIDLDGTPRSRPFVGDYDADGLPDLLVGAQDGKVRLYRALSWDSPSDNGGILIYRVPEFASEELVESPGVPLTTGGYSVPSLADWNADGLSDLIVGEQDVSGGKVRVYLNSGTSELPQYDSFSYVQYSGADLTVPCAGCLGVFPRVFDWNGDGLKDLVLGLSDGRVQVFPNTQAGTEPVFGEPSYLQVGEPGSKTELSVGARATLQIVDWNNDGSHDLVTGGLDGRVRVFLSSADSGEPDLRSQFIVQDSTGDLIVPTGRSGVAVADLNGDGRKDLLLGNTEGQLIYYPNYGTDVAPEFETWQALQADGVEIDLDGTPRSRPFVGDYDADGLPDLLVGAQDGKIRLYRALSWDTPRDEEWQPGEAGEMYDYVLQVPAATWQNGGEPLDVTGDGLVVPLDALLVINELNQPQYTDSFGRLLDPPPDSPPPYLDANGDGYCSSIDALLVINRLNATAAAAVATSSSPALAASPAEPTSAALSCSAIAAAIDCVMAEETDKLRQAFA